MGADYDPRARRLVPLIEELVGTLDEHWSFMLSAADRHSVLPQLGVRYRISIGVAHLVGPHRV